MESARIGDANAVKLAIQFGASVNSPDLHGWAPLHLSAASGHLEVCRALIENGCDVNTTLPDFSTPLMLAVEEAHLPVAKLLLDNGALPRCKDESGFGAQERCDARIKPELLNLLQLSVSDCYRKEAVS